MEYLVDVAMPVYNHEKYIAQAIESIVNQKTKFNFRLIIGEDCSTDNSRAIIAEYAKQYPDIIHPIFREKNIGASANGYNIAAVARSKYVTICEGDDYWTDEYKLQKQVDFMEANPDFTIHFTDIEFVDGQGAPVNNNDVPLRTKDVFTIEDIVNGGVFIPSVSLMYRNVLPHPMPEFYLQTIIADTLILLLLADKGKAKYLNEKTAAYRVHGGGVTRSQYYIDNEYIILCDLLEKMNKYFDYRRDDLLSARIHELSKTVLVYGSRNKRGLEKYRYVMSNFPRYLKSGKRVNVREAVYYLTMLFFPAILKARK